MKKALAFLVYLLLSVPIFAGGVSGGGGGGSGSASDATLTTSDITTNDVSTTKHGFAPKAPNDATKYLNGLGAWAVPAGGGTDIPSLTPATQLSFTDLTIVRQFEEANDRSATLAQVLDPAKKKHGWVSVVPTPYPFSVNGSGVLTFNMGAFTLWVNGRYCDPQASITQDISAIPANTVHYISAEATSGTEIQLYMSTDMWGFAPDYGAVPVCTVMRDTTGGYYIGSELHGYLRDTEWHSWAHRTIGTRYLNGFTGTFTNTTLSVTSGSILDEDLEHQQTSTMTTCRVWYRGTGATYMKFDAAGSVPYKAAAGTLQWDNAGTLTNVSTAGGGAYACYYVYATNDRQSTGTTLAVVTGQTTNSSLTNIRSEALPTFPGMDVLEWKLLYRLIYRNVSGTPTFIEAADYRSVSSGPANVAVASDHQALINRDTLGAHPESAIAFTDITTGDVSTTTHGYAPKAPNDAAQVLLGTGAWGSAPASTPVGYSGENFIDNPNFEVSQFHGSSPSINVTSGDGAAGAHIVDRWRVNQTGGGFNWVVSRNTSDSPTGSVSKYSLKLTSNSAGGGATLIQRFSSDQVRKFRGGACTLGFWYKPAASTTTCTINIKTPSADTNFTTVTTRNESGSGYSVTGLTSGEWTYVNYQFNPSAWTDIANGMQLDVVIPANPSVSAGFADFRLARGTIASAAMSAGFVTPTTAENEARCFPFYQKTFARATAVAQNSGEASSAFNARSYTTVGNNLRFQWWFPVKMRTSSPTVTTYCYNAASSNFTVGSNTSVTASAPYISDSMAMIDGGGSQTIAVGDAVTIHITADNRL